MPEKDN